jgi:cytochrome b
MDTGMDKAMGMDTGRTVKVWDPLVRVFHWGVAGAFALAFATAEELNGVHVNVGYVILALVAARLLWGLVGTRHARFASFVKGPRTVLRYLKDMVLLRAPATVGHNPAAAVMIVALLIALAATGVTGLMLHGAGNAAGPLAGLMAPYGVLEDPLEDVHEFFAGLTLGLVGFHVAGVLFSSLLHRENLIRAMITGRKRVQRDEAEAARMAEAA